MKVEILAYAKLNLFLFVKGKRADGYHEIDSLFHSISLADKLILEKSSGVELCCSLGELNNSQNLAYRAGIAFKKRTGISGVKIYLEKKIPVGAGLGGGSADAAAVIWGLNQLYGEPLSKEEMLSLAASLGSDVPFFLYGGACRVKGRGEKIEPLSPLKGWSAFLFVFPFSLSTARVYASYEANKENLPQDLNEVISRLRKGDRFQLKLYNSLEKVAFKFFPQIREVKEAALKLNFPAAMSGSGPTVFALFRRREAEESLKESWGKFPGKIVKVELIEKGLEVVSSGCRLMQ